MAILFACYVNDVYVCAMRTEEDAIRWANPPIPGNGKENIKTYKKLGTEGKKA
jgi:hypothetical protein